MNADTVWSGGPHDYTNVGSRQHLETLRQLFNNYIMASEVLDVDADFRTQTAGIRSGLRPTQIAPDTGRIVEWAFPAERSGRGGQNNGQTVPLWAVPPGRQITPLDTPELAQAAIKYLQYRVPGIYGYETEGSYRFDGTRVEQDRLK